MDEKRNFKHCKAVVEQNKIFNFISKNSIKRLARKSGVKRISFKSYREINSFLCEFLAKLIKDIIMYYY